MSLVNNPLWIGFGGEPITGRVPTKTIVMAGDMTPAVRAEVQHVYHLFCLAKQAAVGSYFTTNRKLPDGTKVRCVSMLNQDVVYVWTGASSAGTKIPHGFVVVSEGVDPCFYKRIAEDGGGWRWEFGGKPPQIAAGGNATHSNYVRKFTTPSGDDWAVLPVVLPGGMVLWDYARHATKSAVGGLPLATPRPAGGQLMLNPHKPHFASKTTIKSSDGAVLHEFTPPPSAVGLPGGFEGDPLRQLSPNVSADGSTVVLSAYRYGIIAESVSLGLLSSKSEVLEFSPSDAESYLIAAEIGGTLVMKPRMTDAPVTSDVSETGIGVSPQGAINLNFIMVVNLSHPGNGSQHSGVMWRITKKVSGEPVILGELIGTAIWGIGIVPVDLSGSMTSQTDVGYRRTKHSALVEKRYQLLAFGSDSGHFTMEYVSKLDYPEEMYHRAGQSTKSVNYSHPSDPASRDRYGLTGRRCLRANSDESIIGSPSCGFTAWDGEVMEIFGGDVASVMTGHEYIDLAFEEYAGLYYPYGGSTLLTSLDYYNAPITALHTTPFKDWPEGAILYDKTDSYADALAHDMRPTIKAIADGIVPQRVIWEDWDPLKNTVDYELFARVIIDYDHRARFWAGVEIRVKCSGAIWGHPGGDEPRRRNEVKSHPTYTVTFSFVSAWFDPTTQRTVRATKQWRQFSGTRPCFEAESRVHGDPYTWTPNGGEPYSLYSYILPPIAPPVETMNMLTGMSVSQGENKHLASMDFIEQLGGGGDETISKKGIEFSKVEHGREIPHERRPSGMLYARTLSVAEFNSATWIFTATKCNAKENNAPMGEGPWWFYMPEVGAFLSSGEKLHIELRDGELANWSDHLDGVAADRTARGIKLYQV